MAFRYLVPSWDPQRTLTFLSPTDFEDFYEEGSEVPVAPFPRVRDALHQVEWDDIDEYEVTEADDTALASEEPQHHERDPTKEVALDDQVYTIEDEAKRLKKACEERGLPMSGTKKRLLARLHNFKLRLQWEIEAGIAKKLYDEDKRKPVAIKVPKMPSREVQDHHNLTHIPFESWCEACLATRSKEDGHKLKDHKEKVVLSFDFAYTFTNENYEEVLGEHAQPENFPNQNGTMLVATISDTKAVLALPVLAKGTASLKHVVEELVRFSLHNCNQEDIIVQADGERSCLQILKAIQQTRARLNLKTEIRVTGKDQHQSNGAAERAVQSVRRMANCIREFCQERCRHHIGGDTDIYPWTFRHGAWLINRFRVLQPEKMTSYETQYGRQYRGSICAFGESVLYKALSPWKGDAVFKRGVWVGKSTWSDCHVILTPSGAVEARSIRRLPEQFNSVDIHFARGLPWAYTGMGVLMKHGGHRRRREAVPVMDATEEEVMGMTKQIAMGLATPMLAGGGFVTPGAPRTQAAPMTPGRLRSQLKTKA